MGLCRKGPTNEGLTQDAQNTGMLKPQLEYYARLYTDRIDSAKYMTWTHDLRFIIDNMLNLEYLMDVAQLTGRQELADMAVSHATKTMKNHFREDYSCYHVVSYNPKTGEPEVKNSE